MLLITFIRVCVDLSSVLRFPIAPRSLTDNDLPYSIEYNISRELVPSRVRAYLSVHGILLCCHTFHLTHGGLTTRISAAHAVTRL